MSAASLGGCSSKAGDPCKGGTIINGQCTFKCSPDLCAAGNTCVNNACALKCTSHDDCSTDGSQSCHPAVEDGTSAAINICGPSAKPGFGVACPNGNECAASFHCLTEGIGDAQAYCTIDGCSADTDCGAGFYCALTRDPHGECGSTTIKGNNGICGKTTEACINAADLASKGLIEGAICLQKKTCLKRDACAPCATDLDCSLVAGQKCGNVAGAPVCVHTCNVDNDCPLDAKCTDGSCIPRSGACRGTGKFCEPCMDDRDCGPVGTPNVCLSFGGNMRACFDVSYSNTCMTTADCPAAPSGLHGTCLDESSGVASDNPVYHHCALPQNAATKETCW